MVLLEEFIQLAEAVELQLLVTVQMEDLIQIHQEDLEVQELQQVFLDHQPLTLVVEEVHFITHLHNHLVEQVAEVAEVMLLHLIKEQVKMEQIILVVVEAVVYLD